MRLSAALLIAASLVPAGAFAQPATPVCTGLCLQQLPANSCPGNATTTISGVVYAPNGTDPLPNVLVYVPNDVVPAFTPGVQCPIVGAPPDGSPLVGATTGINGSFTISNVPVGTNIPLVIISGRWRRQIVIPTVTGCTDNPLAADQTRFPRNQSEGDIPLFAIATGGVDSVECVLRKVGLQDIEFTDPAGNPSTGYVGRIQFYTGSGGPGTKADSATPSQTQLMSNLTTLQNYDVLMLPCQGGQYSQTATAENNFDTFVNNGGRVYSSHYSYVWMYYPGYTNGPFAGVANWQVNAGSYADGTATINQGFAGGIALAQWLQQPAIGATTTLGQMPIQTLKKDLAAPAGVIAPTQSWFTLNTTNNPVMQMVFDTPIAATNQCGRVLYNEYHVETASSGGTTFPNECSTNTTMTPQEKLLEYMLFELTDQGGAATLTPITQDFGTNPINFASASKSFTLTNNSTFVANNPTITTTGDFSVSSNNCSSIPAGSSCTINVIFTPTMIGAETGTLSVSVGATGLISTLTGTGTPDLSFSIPNLTYNSVDVGASASQTFSITNTASGPVGVSGVTITSSTAGDYTYTTTCPTGTAKLAAGTSCTLSVIFKPTVTGPITGKLAVSGSGATPTTLTGNGIDFTLVTQTCGGNPVGLNSGTVIAGDSITFCSLTSPLAGFANNITLSCATNVPGATCVVNTATSFAPVTAVTSNITIFTTSQYAVIGYGAGFGLWMIGLGSGAFLLVARRRAGTLVRVALICLMFAAASAALSGCSGKLPAKNAVYTAAGTYSGTVGVGGSTGTGGTGTSGSTASPGFTVIATDGFLVHSANFALTVTAK